MWGSWREEGMGRRRKRRETDRTNREREGGAEIQSVPDKQIKKNTQKRNRTHYPLVELEPRGVALGVHVLQAEEPDLPEADGLHHLIEQLFSGGVGLDRELQLRVHGRHPHIYLLEGKK